MPNLRGVVRLPQKLKHLKEVPVEQFLEGQLGQVRPVDVKPFTWWAYCLITSGIVASVVMGILIYNKWGDTIAGCLPDARMKSGNRGARASVRYSSDPGQEMVEPPSPEECNKRQKVSLETKNTLQIRKWESRCKSHTCRKKTTEKH